MSTDRQDLSPVVQKHAIAGFAAAHGLEIVRSYEDQGRSGLQLANRPRLRQLLQDVAEAVPFSVILVYDVSRWGRFQDPDAAAYHEYHCRMHGVQIIYVNESFGTDQTPVTVLLRSMRRVMAAEFSRDLACKARAGQERVVSMGFHMGPLPALGYRRCSVSADGSRRLPLQHGQRKAALTDRVEWVLGPDAEVDLVRRICTAYGTGLELDEIAGLVNAEGWRTDKERRLSPHGLKVLLTNEALIGNFVWGIKSQGGKVILSAPTRRDGSVPRIVDDVTWGLMQARLKGAAQAGAAKQARLAETPNAPATARRPLQLRLALPRTGALEAYRRTIGAPEHLRNHAREFGRALSAALRAEGLPTRFDTRYNVMSFWGARVRIRLMWPSEPGTWILETRRPATEVPHVLVTRMTALYRPLDFFLLPLDLLPVAFSDPLHMTVPRRLRKYWCASGEEVIGRLSRLPGAASTVLSRAGTSIPEPGRLTQEIRST